MDLSQTIIPKSDQINAEDVMASGPITVTVKSVSKGKAEQPVDIHLVEYPGRAYRPNKTMRRVLVKAWGKESDAYTGHRMTLYYDPDVPFGGVKVGGIKVSHVSHIAKRLDLALTETRGKRVVHTIQPLPDTAPAPAPAPTVARTLPEPSAERVAACDDLNTLDRMWQASGPERRAQIEARVSQLDAPVLDEEPAPADDEAWGSTGGAA